MFYENKKRLNQTDRYACVYIKDTTRRLTYCMAALWPFGMIDISQTHYFYVSLSLYVSISFALTQTMLQYHSNQFFSITNDFSDLFFFSLYYYYPHCTAFICMYNVCDHYILANICKYFIIDVNVSAHMYVFFAFLKRSKVVWWQTSYWIAWFHITAPSSAIAVYRMLTQVMMVFWRKIDKEIKGDKTNNKKKKKPKPA